MWKRNRIEIMYLEIQSNRKKVIENGVVMGTVQTTNNNNSL